LAAWPDGTGSKHQKRSYHLLGHLSPGQALGTKLKDLLSGDGMRRRSATSQSDAGAVELLAERAPMNAQLDADLA
jgi:hypothetical protein